MRSVHGQQGSNYKISPVTARCLKCSRRRQPGQVRAFAELFYGVAPLHGIALQRALDAGHATEPSWWMVRIERRPEGIGVDGVRGRHPKGDPFYRYERLGRVGAGVVLGPCYKCGHRPQVATGRLVAEVQQALEAGARDIFV